VPKRGVDKPWSEYRLGMIVAASVVVVGAAIFLVGSTCGPLRPAVHSYQVDLDDVAGLRVGSIVRVGGIDAGEVTDIIIVPPQGESIQPLGPGDTLPLPQAFVAEPDVHIEISIREPYDRNVTASSRAQLAMLGAGAERYVKITPGDVRERPLEPGAHIPIIASVDLDLVLGRLARAFNEIIEITALTDEIKAKIAARRGSLGRLTQVDAELYRQVDALQREAYALMDLMDHGPGFITLYRQDRQLQAEIDSLGADVAAIRASLADPNGVFQAYAEPEELRVALRDLRAEVAELDARLEGGPGSLGRFLNDEELFIQVRVLQQRVAAVAEAFKKDPLSFVNIRIF
jgi:ABC-type transporter Mla subunit MlaD